MASAEGTQAVVEPGQKDHTVQVAKHYNQLQEGGLAERTKSRIFYLRNFNNWIKSMSIAKYLALLREDKGHNARISVMDLCSGKGGDLLKWKKGEIDKLVCADIAGTSVEQSEVRYNEMLSRAGQERRGPRLFSAEFITADCTKTRLKTVYKDPNTKFDLVSCQFSFHYSFESYPQADVMLRNACECLKPGGYFIGTTPNAYELVKRLKASDGMSFESDVYRVTFKTDNKEDLPLFGCEYDFHLEGVVDCPEFLVYIPLLQEMAKRYGMELVSCTRFDKFFEQQIQINDGRALIGRMQALEPYPADNDVDLMGNETEDYVNVKEKMAENSEAEDGNQRDQRSHRKYGTLSKSEWEATSIYLLFVFKRVEEICPDYCDEASQTAEAEATMSQVNKDTTEDESSSNKQSTEHSETDDGQSPCKKQRT